MAGRVVAVTGRVVGGREVTITRIVVDGVVRVVLGRVVSVARIVRVVAGILVSVVCRVEVLVG